MSLLYHIHVELSEESQNSRDNDQIQLMHCNSLVTERITSALYLIYSELVI